MHSAYSREGYSPASRRFLASLASAALSSDLPSSGASISSFLIKGQRENLTNTSPAALHAVITPAYFVTTHIATLRTALSPISTAPMLCMLW